MKSCTRLAPAVALGGALLFSGAAFAQQAAAPANNDLGNGLGSIFTAPVRIATAPFAALGAPPSGYIASSPGYVAPPAYVAAPAYTDNGFGATVGSLVTAPVAIATAPFSIIGGTTSPLMTGRSVAVNQSGESCQTPVRTCELREPSFVGNGCSCKVAGGRARGSVIP